MRRASGDDTFIHHLESGVKTAGKAVAHRRIRTTRPAWGASPHPDNSPRLRGTHGHRAW